MLGDVTKELIVGWIRRVLFMVVARVSSDVESCFSSRREAGLEAWYSLRILQQKLQLEPYSMV